MAAIVGSREALLFIRREEAVVFAQREEVAAAVVGKGSMTVVGRGGCWEDDQRSDLAVVVPNKR